MPLSLILLAFAFVFAAIAAVGWPTIGRVHLGWAALALFILAEMVGAGAPLFR